MQRCHLNRLLDIELKTLAINMQLSLTRSVSDESFVALKRLGEVSLDILGGLVLLDEALVARGSSELLVINKITSMNPIQDERTIVALS